MGSRQGAAGISDLPDDALVCVFEHLDRVERHSRLAFVCTRWARLVCSPALLRSVQFEPRPRDRARQILARLQSWSRQIVQRGRNGVEEFMFDVRLARIDAAISKSMAEQLVAAVAAAASGSRLTHLRLDCSLPAIKACMLPELHTLKYLSLLPEPDWAAEAAPELASCRLPSLTYLTRLEHFRLAVHWVAASSIFLPQSLTCVHLNLEGLGYDDGANSNAERDVENVKVLLNAQVVVLPHLRRFAVSDCEFLLSNRSLAALTRVASTLKELSALESDVPEFLSALTGLEALQVHGIPDFGDEAADSLEDALPHLQRLTRLDLGEMPFVPATVTSLQHLADLRLHRMEGQLPGGRWLSGLRSLEVSFCSIGAAALGMRQLERLQLNYDGKQTEEEPLTQALTSAAKLGSLRRLQLVTNQAIPLVACEALLGVQRRRPHLRIELLRPESVL